MTITILLHTLSILNPKTNLHKIFSVYYIHISIFNKFTIICLIHSKRVKPQHSTF